MPTFPQQFRKGRHRVSIYREGERFRVRYYQGATRKSRTLGNLVEAQNEAQRILKRLVNGEPNPTPLSKRQERVLREAERVLLETGATVDEACRQWAAAIRRLPEGVGLEEVIAAYERSHGRVPRSSLFERAPTASSEVNARPNGRTRACLYAKILLPFQGVPAPPRKESIPGLLSKAR